MYEILNYSWLRNGRPLFRINVTSYDFLEQKTRVFVTKVPDELHVTCTVKDATKYQLHMKIMFGARMKF